MSATSLLTGTGLCKSFGPTPALRGVDLSLNAGEMLAVMGPSGSGKSTLLHCLAGIIRPDAGEVFFDGRRIDHLGDRERSLLRRTAFGFVFQFGQLVPELPVLENIALPLLLAGRRRRAAIAAADEWLPRLGLHGVGHKLPGDLSGGQGQRVAIARALVGRPQVVFADEPTGSLDSVASDQVMELLVDAAKAERAGVLIVTHEARIAAFADRQITIRDGTAVSAATTIAS